MKLGDRIKVYEVLTDGGYKAGVYKIGSFRPANSTHGIYVFLKSDKYWQSLTMKNNTECRHVATMRITKLK